MVKSGIYNSSKPTARDEVITSTANAEVKKLRSLHDRKFRKQTGWFLAEGLRILTEAVQLGHAPKRLVLSDGRADDAALAPLISACTSSGGRVLTVTPSLMERIARKDNPQMVLGAFEQKFSGRDKVTGSTGSDIWIALDRVRDPGNLGTIMRTADAVGARGIILIDDCTDPYSVEAVRASMGAVFNVELVHTDTAGFEELSQKWSGEIIGTALPSSSDFRDARWSRPLILLMGNEQQGLTDRLCATATQLVRLEMHGRSDSLNLAVATGICLYEALRSR